MIRHLPLLAAAGSLALLLAALFFQYVWGLAPCALCIWQRWPHVLAVAAGAGALVSPWASLFGLGATLWGAGIALYHSGIEQDWWDGPASCTASNDIGSLTVEELMAQIEAAPLIRCDEIAWNFLGLSMANWNGLATLGLAAIWGLALVKMPHRD